jgi:hypothetical protein
MVPTSAPPDTLNEVGVLKRREIEARILIPVLEALGQEFGRERVLAFTRDVIVDVARQQGRALAPSARRPSCRAHPTATFDSG